MKVLKSALMCLLVGAVLSSGISANDKSSLRSANQKTAATADAAASKTNKNEAEMFTNLLQPHSIQTFQLRPTSTLIFEVDNVEDEDAENSKLDGKNRRTLLQGMLPERPANRADNAADHYGELAGLHGVYGSLRRLSDADFAPADGDISAGDNMRRLIAKHDALLDQFNSERHLSRFERHEQEMERRERRVLLEEKNVDVDEAATAITEAAVETLYEGVLPVITEPANAMGANQTVAEAAMPEGAATSLCSANAQCVAQGLTGQCCPTNDGTYLACCPSTDKSMSSPDIIPPPPGSDVEAPVITGKAAAAAAGGVSAAPHEPETPIIDNAPVDPVMAEASAIIEDLFDGENPDMVDIIEEEHEEEEAFKEMAEAAGIIPAEEEETLIGGRLDSYQTTPLGQGYGTHYAHVWVGSPKPQRQSVIVDTGSHHTAFPCKECSNCGESYHTDNYFDWSKSATFHPLTCSECEPGASCAGDKCQFSQSYTEGSSWHAYQVKDQLFCGGNEPDAWNNPVDRSYAIDFTFGCQTSETGLFIKQLADGIMGMAANDATLTKRMHDAGKIEHLMFAMCFRRELHQSKEGVTAGVLTMGGVDTRLHSSPMVYARNTVHQGWFTVYVRKLYLRSSGGQTAKADDSDQHIAEIRMNLSQVNSGKGVIVDSGTTDTYFHRSLKAPFEEAFKAVSGRDHSNRAIKLSHDELMALPTLLVQLDAFDEKMDPSFTGDNLLGLAGAELDEDRPADVILAIPATHYMEYDPQADSYTSRLYFSEGSGGVLGANAMMGHDILFDWENQRVGFAESSCEYVADIAGDFAADGEVADEGGVENDCVLGVPSMSMECADSVDMSLCQGNGVTKVTGKEKWTMVVESPGTLNGLSCEEIILRDYAEDKHEEHEHPSPPIAFCDGNGLCFKERVCEMTCAEAMEDIKEEADIVPADMMGGDEDDDNTDDDFFAEFQPCGDNLWGACEASCMQEKIVSTLMSDGICHEDQKMRKRRPCHIDACGRSDPCRVPFVVHAVLGFRGANAKFWSRTSQDEFIDAFSLAVDFNSEDGDELIGPGDVKVLSALPWFENDDPARKALGLKMILEISVYNENAKLPRGFTFDPITEEKAEVFEVNATAHTPNSMDAAFNIIDNVKHMWENWSRPLATCEESDIQPLGKNALDVHVELERPKFMTELLSLLRQLNEVSRYASPFAPIFRNMAFAEDSKVLTSWTIKTEIDGGTLHEHPISSLKGINSSNMMQYITNGPFMLLVIVMLFSVCCCGMCFGSRCCASRGFNNKQVAALLDELDRRKKEKDRGKYSQVGINGHASDGEYSDEEEDDYSFSNSRMTHEVRFSSNDRANEHHDGDLELAGMNGMHKAEDSEEEEAHDHSLEELEGMDGGVMNVVSGLKTEIS